MILRDGIGEKQIEPVGIAELGRLQVAVAGCLSILQAILSCYRVVLTQLLEHVAIDTRVLSVGKVL